MDGNFAPLVRKVTTKKKAKASKKKILFESDDDEGGFGGMQSAFKDTQVYDDYNPPQQQDY